MPGAKKYREDKDETNYCDYRGDGPGGGDHRAGTSRNHAAHHAATAFEGPSRAEPCDVQGRSRKGIVETSGGQGHLRSIFILTRCFAAFLIACSPLRVSWLHAAFQSACLALVRTEPINSSVLGLYKSRTSARFYVFSTERAFLGANHLRSSASSSYEPRVRSLSV